jgi:hypothetical protein
MDYSLIGPEQMLEGIQNRIGQLEAEHYTNAIYLIECDLLGDKKTSEQLTTRNKFIETLVTRLQGESEVVAAQVETKPAEES